MSPKITFIASALGVSAALASHAHADVIYTVLNPANNFTLFVCDSFRVYPNAEPLGRVARRQNAGQEHRQHQLAWHQTRPPRRREVRNDLGA
jgi:hypothetical protein